MIFPGEEESVRDALGIKSKPSKTYQPYVYKKVSGGGNTVAVVPRAKKSGPARLMAPVSESSRIVSRQAVQKRVLAKKSGVTGQRVKNKELINASVAGSTTWTLQGPSASQGYYSINPGILAAWLAIIAPQYEQYYIHDMGFEFVPTCSTATSGDVQMMIDYDASDPSPTSEVQMVDHAGAVTDSCWKRLSIKLKPSEVACFGRKKYVRSCAVAGDIKTFDSGKFYLSTNNQSGTSVIGKLYVTYDVEFFVPQNNPSPDSTPLYVSDFYNSATQTFTTTVQAAVNFSVLQFDPLNVGPAGTVFTPPAGCYKLSFHGSFKDSSAETFTVLCVLLKNGSQFPASYATQTSIDSGAANGQLAISDEWIVPCNGTDTVSVAITCTGAAGTLTLLADCGHLIWNLA